MVLNVLNENVFKNLPKFGDKFNKQYRKNGGYGIEIFKLEESLQVDRLKMLDLIRMKIICDEKRRTVVKPGIYKEEIEGGESEEEEEESEALEAQMDEKSERGDAQRGEKGSGKVAKDESELDPRQMEGQNLLKLIVKLLHT
jgi:hypothetical protein